MQWCAPSPDLESTRVADTSVLVGSFDSSGRRQPGARPSASGPQAGSSCSTPRPTWRTSASPHLHRARLGPDERPVHVGGCRARRSDRGDRDVLPVDELIGDGPALPAGATGCFADEEGSSAVVVLPRGALDPRPSSWDRPSPSSMPRSARRPTPRWASGRSGPRAASCGTCPMSPTRRPGLRVASTSGRTGRCRSARPRRRPRGRRLRGPRDGQRTSARADRRRAPTGRGTSRRDEPRPGAVCTDAPPTAAARRTVMRREPAAAWRLGSGRRGTPRRCRRRRGPGDRPGPHRRPRPALRCGPRERHDLVLLAEQLAQLEENVRGA